MKMILKKRKLENGSTSKISMNPHGALVTQGPSFEKRWRNELVLLREQERQVCVIFRVILSKRGKHVRALRCAESVPRAVPFPILVPAKPQPRSGWKRARAEERRQCIVGRRKRIERVAVYQEEPLTRY